MAITLDVLEKHTSFEMEESTKSKASPYPVWISIQHFLDGGIAEIILLHLLRGFASVLIIITSLWGQAQVMQMLNSVSAFSEMSDSKSVWKDFSSDSKYVLFFFFEMGLTIYPSLARTHYVE